jgi:DNA gyrase subunit A
MTEPIEDVVLHEAARERYLNYALSVITSRALPDVRDGMKPVQRRILYAMYHNLHLTPDSKHRKSAAVVGEVMAKYHPHGDQSIYDAMVRMAQPFALRYPLVDGQGNFGSLDGDSAAAMRYTEAKLTHLSVEVLSELKKRTVDYRQNYDGTMFEPIVLPAQVPQLLINGVTGIAVGMATNIPPHNLKEVVNALLAMIEDRDIPLEKIVGKIIKGPDFPTGGEILNSREELLEIYATGSGAIETRGEYFIEEEGRKQQIVLTSIPYVLLKSELVEQIAQHISEGKVPQLLDVRDESTDEIRVVLELKRDANAEAAMAYLYRKTDLQKRFNVNMTALVPVEGTDVAQPRKLGLLDVLRYFLDFRHEVTTRRLNFDLEELERRIHLLRAFAIIFDALDEAIRIIRESDGKADARQRLMARFGLDEEQAEAILETKLYRLAKLEINAIRAELAEKEAAAAEIRAVLGDDRRLWELVRSELTQIRDAFGDKRRSKVVGPQEERNFSQEAYIVAEDSHVIVTRGGWFKRQKSYTELSAIRVREGDEVRWVVPASTRETVIFFTDRGRAFTMRVADVPLTTGHGEPIQTKFSFADGETIVGVLTSDERCLPVIANEELDKLGPDDPIPPYFIALTRGGKTLRMSILGFSEPSTVNGRLFMRLDPAVPDDAILSVRVGDGRELVSIATRQGRCLVFPISEVNVLSGPGKGVMAIKLVEGDRVAGFRLMERVVRISKTGDVTLHPRDPMDGLEIETNRGRTEIVRPNKFGVSERGNRGREIIRVGYIARVADPVVVMRFRKVDEAALAEEAAAIAARAAIESEEDEDQPSLLKDFGADD